MTKQGVKSGFGAVVVIGLVAGLLTACEDQGGTTPGTPPGGGTTHVLPRISAINVAGTGCAAGSVTTDVLEVEAEIKIESAEYAAASGRKNCAVAIETLDVPKDQRVVARAVVLEGDYALEAGASAQLSAELFTPGAVGEKLEQRLGSGVAEAGLIDFDKAPQELVKGKCGESALIRLNTAVFIKGAVADSQVAIKAIRVGLHLEACTAE